MIPFLIFFLMMSPLSNISEIPFSNTDEIRDNAAVTIQAWFRERYKKKYKCDIDCLSKEDIKKLYDAFSNHQKVLLKIEYEKEKRLGRLPSFPDNISENIVLQILKITHPDEKWTWNCKKGDIYNTTNKIQGEVKACQNGPTSFTPKKDLKKDTLFYLDVSQHLEDGYIELYRIDKYYSTLKNIKVNSSQTFEEQQNQGRRARLNLKNFINDSKIWSGKISDLLN